MNSSYFVSWDWWNWRGRVVSYGVRFFASLCKHLHLTDSSGYWFSWEREPCPRGSHES